MNVFVKAGSKADRFCRAYGGGKSTSSEAAAAGASPAAAAKGFTARPDLDLHDQGGKIIKDLVYTNFFLGGQASWDAGDIQNIDSNLADAMSDRNLNNVIIQYFRGAAAISTTFEPSTVIEGALANSVSQADIENLVRQFKANGALDNFDLKNTVFNFMLPRGIVLTIDDGLPARKSAKKKTKNAETDEKSSSLEGLGGFHGSVHVGSKIIFYAVGVFAEGQNGIDVFDQPWKNVVATFYHELNEARTDAGVEDNAVAWVNNESPSEEIGDIPMTLAGSKLKKVMVEVPRTKGPGLLPIQLMWSNAVHAPEGPVLQARPPTN
jgi:hypothetical protein